LETGNLFDCDLGLRNARGHNHSVLLTEE